MAIEIAGAAAPSAAITGVISEDTAALRAALISAGATRVIGPGDPLNLAPIDNLVLDHALALHGALVRRRTLLGLEQLRRAGACVVIASHDEALLEEICDEVWWLESGAIRAQGDPRQVLDAWRSHVAERFAAWGAQASQALLPSMRRGDGRAQVEEVVTLDAAGAPTRVWRSGTEAAIRVAVRFQAAVADPVVGVMLRTRIGMEVYGTNTQLENVPLGPVAAGERLTLFFRFRCDLCPQEYTVTAASHDPDGVWHDWLEDAIAVSVADTRYTAGVANLRARVEVQRG
jgi:lipopolysaccharide transport system ATP-binding protein